MSIGSHMKTIHAVVSIPSDDGSLHNLHGLPLASLVNWGSGAEQAAGRRHRAQGSRAAGKRMLRHSCFDPAKSQDTCANEHAFSCTAAARRYLHLAWAINPKA